MGNAIYSMTKCGIDAYMRSSALELAAKGIRCNSVNPAMVETRILDRGQLTPEQYEADKLRYPLKRYGNLKRSLGLLYIYCLMHLHG